MRRIVLAVFVLSLVLVLALPTIAMADASVRQDSCINYLDDGRVYARIKFTIINFSLPTAVCDLHFIPEPYPATPFCEMLSTIDAVGWSSFLQPGGGAVWLANTPGDCIPPGSSKSGFGFILDPGFCCYIVQFTDATGAVIAEQEECFCDKTVPIRNETWGAIKALFKD